MYPSRFTSALRVAKSCTALESMYATSGGFPPATCVSSLSRLRSAGTFCISIVMFGCSCSNAFTNDFICGDSPTHDENVTVVGESGSCGTIGWTDACGVVFALLLSEPPPPTQAAATIPSTASRTSHRVACTCLRTLTVPPPRSRSSPDLDLPTRAQAANTPREHVRQQTDLCVASMGPGFVPCQPNRT